MKSTSYNRTMPDFGSKQFQSSLADTAVWYKMKAVGIEADSDGIRQRHALYAQAEQQWEEAQETLKRDWLSLKITDTKTVAERDGTAKADSGFLRTYGT
jgi:ATP:corrinoid adenosyltransferase